MVGIEHVLTYGHAIILACINLKNKRFPYRWSPASLTLNIYFYLFSIVYHTSGTKYNHTQHLKPDKNRNRRAALGPPSIKLLVGLNLFSVDQLSPFVLLWFLRHLVFRFAWKIPSWWVHYLRNMKVKKWSSLEDKTSMRTQRNSNTEIPVQKEPTS